MGVVLDLRCDVCGRPATVIRPATNDRDLALNCDYDATKGFGWGDTVARIADLDPVRLDELLARPDFGGRFDNNA